MVSEIMVCKDVANEVMISEIMVDEGLEKYNNYVDEILKKLMF